MKIRILQIGKNKDAYIEEGVNEFLKRLKSFAQVKIETLKEISPSKTYSTDRCVEEEGKQILNVLSAAHNTGTFVIVLDEHGKEFTSTDFARFIGEKERSGTEVIFVIGGPFGLSQNIKQKANLVLSISKMTLTHQMIRLLLLEQIYRAFCISRGKEYHH